MSEGGMRRAVDAGEIRPRNGITRQRETFLFGAQLWRSVVLPADVRPFLADCGIGLRIKTDFPDTDAITAAATTGQVLRWTDARVAELESYKQKYGLGKTAEHYKVSEARVTAVLKNARKKAEKKAENTKTNFATGLGKRSS